MGRFDRLLEATTEAYNDRINNHPGLPLVLEGRMKREHYIRYLREIYHVVCHTTRIYSLAGARLGNEDRELRDWFFEESHEENNHDLMCISDLRAYGEDPERVLAEPPMAGAWGIIAQGYYLATYGNPTGILGVASVTEAVGATLTGTVAQALAEQYGYKPEQTTFLRAHSGFDVKHIEDVKNAVNTLVRDSDFDAIIQGRRMTIHFYSQMFDDILAAC
ncbi:Pyrroloquinoline quinone (Coenzyme PQQ) biosynthesis protein C [Mycobacterium basiliense]|uniref:Pyrroloquinoline quinone (Coenzyme PQQ) biosynthesis protein C n=1 Tax=Mycobacterium basiliense TaxID=2094119 RepID=A0A447GF06_9MYCO|nr:iron-containing redox enzyme family protein [Mycobacterium basiliense]VDM89056.1 Pyrroloquinoline quinone (Coenzyme PQQ) biosynthesis protein C [Mycobacterium basiliense]